MSWKTFGLAVILVLAMTAGTSFATSAHDVVQRPCSIMVTDTPLEDLVVTMFEGTGVKVVFECAPPEATVTMNRQSDAKICELLDLLLPDQGYCWWTLGGRIYIDKTVKLKEVQSGKGYLYDQCWKQRTILRVRDQTAQKAGPVTNQPRQPASATGPSGAVVGVLVRESYGAIFAPDGIVFVRQRAAGIFAFSP